jgi:hypothetical protein
MNFAAFNFLSSQPRGFLVALLALTFSPQGEAFATDGQRTCTAVATSMLADLHAPSVSHEAREGEQLSAGLVSAGFGVTNEAPAGLGVGRRAFAHVSRGTSRELGTNTGRPAGRNGDDFRGSPARGDQRRAAGLTGPLCRPRGNYFRHVVQAGRRLDHITWTFDGPRRQQFIITPVFEDDAT